MIRLFTGIIILCLGSFDGLHAQHTVTSSVKVIVNIVPGIEVKSISDLNFGIIASNTGLNSLNISDDAAGRFLITGAENAEINLDFIIPSQLYGYYEHSIEYIPTIAYSYSYNYGEFTYLDHRSTTPVRLNGSTVEGATGGVYISISGSIIAGNVPEGIYSGIITLSATYN
ncbi:MAG: hypothetical protein EA364_06475 [Balneolaceae bacterium]|nr:MAG: hypothetical protein EA364_06475 [Balneolaceae bacterium]